MNDMEPTPALGGADIELGNYISGRPGHACTCGDAAQAVMRAVRGRRTISRPPQAAYGYDTSRSAGNGTTPSDNPQDRWRTFLPGNGGCIYIDLDHVELCVPEVRSAGQFVTYWHAMLRLAAEARHEASELLPDGETVHLLVNNSDGFGNSYGAHLNVLVSRRLMSALLSQRLGPTFFLASYLVSSQVFTGAGKVGSEHRRPAVAYQLSQRADFMETVGAIQTTHQRPIVNLRDEAHCGDWRPADDASPAARWARAHVIFHDANLCHVANYLKFGALQIILALLDSGYVDPRLILDDPVAACWGWSHDISLRRTATTIGAENLTAVELQQRFHESAAAFVDDGRCTVPDAPRIIELWGQVLQQLRDAAAGGSLQPLMPRLDWVLKLACIQQTLREQPDSDFADPAIKYLDQIYGSLSSLDGLYLACDASGAVERIAANAAIERAIHEPPDDTRAWTRAMMLRRAADHRLDRIDWDEIRFKATGGAMRGTRAVRMPDPTRHDRAAIEPLLDESDGSLDAALDALDAPWVQDPAFARTRTTDWTSGDELDGWSIEPSADLDSDPTTG